MHLSGVGHPFEEGHDDCEGLVCCEKEERVTGEIA